MRRMVTLCLIPMLLALLYLPAAAVNGQVIYVEDSEKFFFLPGSDRSPTDLFPEFKDVMPGDSIEQRIVIKNDVSNECKIKVYIRAKGAHEDSVDFLSQMHLSVEKGTDTALFDAAADQTAQLTDWVYLGTLYSGGECELIVTLDVPVTMDNRFKDQVGYLDWEFAVEELPVEGTDPKPPQTGDESQIALWAVVMAASMVLLIWLPLYRKKREER